MNWLIKEDEQESGNADKFITIPELQKTRMNIAKKAQGQRKGRGCRNYLEGSSDVSLHENLDMTTSHDKKRKQERAAGKLKHV